MILETGRIVSVESEGVWVETIRKSVCGSCKAEKGCGQSLINKWDGHSVYIWVLLEGRNSADYLHGDEIQIGIPEDIIVKASLLVYVLPLVIMITATIAAHQLFAHEAITALSALFGLLLGGVLVRWYSWRTRFNPDIQPVIVDDRKPLHFFKALEQH